MALAQQVKIKELSEYGFKLLSPYKNLDTEIKLSCKSNHEFTTTLKEFRKSLKCPICKQTESHKTLALDNATNITGYAIIQDGKLLDYGLIKSKGKDSVERICDMTDKIMQLIETEQPNFVILEDIFISAKDYKNTETFKKLSRLQGSLLYKLHKNKNIFHFVYPSFWRGILKINGKDRQDSKLLAQKAVYKNFGINVTEDEADAICIAFCSEEIRQEEKEVKTTEWII